jgi:RHS repeat-associated protein
VNAIYGPNNVKVISYASDAQNHRIWSWAGAADTYGNTTNYTVNVYSPGGQKLGAYELAPGFISSGGIVVPTMQVTLSSSDQYFGSRRLAIMDQLGSTGTSNSPAPSYFPWGEPRNSNPQDAWSFATYWTDSASGLDYANNRYYSNAYGRFMTPDPSQASGGPADPQSWNRYAYTRGDPVNRFDPWGTDDCAAQFADASQPYDPDSSCSGPPGYSCPGLALMTEFQDDPDAATFYGQAAAMGCASAPATEVATSTPIPSIPAINCGTALDDGLTLFLSEKGSPLASDVAQLIQVGQADDIDPTLLAAMAIAENGQATNNPFSLGTNGRNTYPSLSAAINAVGATLQKYIYTWNESTVSALWSGNVWKVQKGKPWITTQYPGYCVGTSPASAAGCQNTGKTISGFMQQIGVTDGVGGNPNKLQFPCPE